MRFLFLLIVTFMAFTYDVCAQQTKPVIKGQITFVTTSNVYARFDNTSDIGIGDSLQLTAGGPACLVVKSKSSTSCVCTAVSGCDVEKGDEVFYIHTPKIEVFEEESLTENDVFEERDMMRATALPEEPPEEPLYDEEYRGSLALSSYHLLNSDRTERHQFMSRFALNAAHINDSRFSFDTYMSYRHILEDQDAVALPKNSFLRVYNLNARMDVNPSLSFTLGRSINPKASSLGAIDGLQAEKYIGNYYVGAIIGFRPDIFDYGFNADLIQYGGYFGLKTNSDNTYSETTLGFMEQRAMGDIDRRYTYLQHTSTLFKDLNLFAMAEMDIFSKVNYTTKNDIRLTNLYLSARYRFSRNFNLMLSYDSRKRILYYETFQSDIERLLDEDLARQGARARISVRPFKYVYAGASYAKRFQSDNENKSDNINGYVTFSRIPELGGRATLSYNRNMSNYLESDIGSLRYSRDFLKNKLYGDFYYRFVNYSYTNLSDPLQQHYVGADLTYYITRKLLFSISGEYTTYNEENNFRFYTRIVQRFNSK